MAEQFAIRDPMTVKLAHSQSRNEMHGNDLVPALDLQFTAQATNVFLDRIDPGLRHVFCERPSGGKQEDLDSMQNTPARRCGNLIEMPIKVTKEYVGYKLTIIVGTGRDASNIEIPDCKVNKFVFDIKDGGAMPSKWRVQASGVSAGVIGQCGVMHGKEVTITLTPPTAAEERAQAEKALAGEKKKAAEKAGKDKTPSAEELFAAGGEPPAGEAPAADAPQESVTP